MKARNGAHAGSTPPPKPKPKPKPQPKPSRPPDNRPPTRYWALVAVMFVTGLALVAWSVWKAVTT